LFPSSTAVVVVIDEFLTIFVVTIVGSLLFNNDVSFFLLFLVDGGDSDLFFLGDDKVESIFLIQFSSKC
jgi:hypothetical protein